MTFIAMLLFVNVLLLSYLTLLVPFGLADSDVMPSISMPKLSVPPSPNIIYTQAIKQLQTDYDTNKEHCHSFPFNITQKCGPFVRNFAIALIDSPEDFSPSLNEPSTGNSSNQRDFCCYLWPVKQCLVDGLHEALCDATLVTSLTSFTSNVNYFHLIFGNITRNVTQICGSTYPEKSNCELTGQVVTTVFYAIMLIFFSICFLIILFCIFA